MRCLWYSFCNVVEGTSVIASIVDYARIIVSCGPCASIPYASISTSLFALPLLIFFHVVHWFLPTLCMVLLSMSACCVVASCIIVAYTQQPTGFIIDKVIGAMITFISIPFKAKFMLVGFALFHIIRIALPRLFACIRLTPNAIWSGVLSSLCAGVISNLILRSIIWIGS